MGANHHTLISKGTRIVGDVHFSGELSVQGLVSGNIIGEANAELEVTKLGKVEGQIQVPKLIVRGLVQGDIRCSTHVELAATAVVNGNVYYHMLEMVKGAQVNGSMVFVEASQQEKKADKKSDAAA